MGKSGYDRAMQAELARTLHARLVASYQHLMGTVSPIAITAALRP